MRSAALWTQKVKICLVDKVSHKQTDLDILLAKNIFLYWRPFMKNLFFTVQPRVPWEDTYEVAISYELFIVEKSMKVQ